MLFIFSRTKHENCQICSRQDQIKAWRRASRKMAWAIAEYDFESLPPTPDLTEEARRDGFIGPILSYGFGDDGHGDSDPVLSGKLAWDYARKRMRARTWQCQYIDFEKPDHIRLRPQAPPRPRGFYWAQFQPGKKFQDLTVARVLKRLHQDTACGPEGIQFLAVTHPHFVKMMDAGKIPFMSFGDYDVAPYGYNDFFDALQMFCSNGVLGLGIGNVDNNYPLFGIPTLRFSG